MSFRLKLFPKFLIWIVILSVLPVAIIGRIVVDINDESLQFEVQRYHLRLASSLADKIDERLTTLQSQLSMGITAFKDPYVSWPERQLLLSSLIDASPYFGIISAVSPDGQELLKVYNPQIAPEVEENPALISHKNIELFKRFTQTKKQTVEVIKDQQRTFAMIYIPFTTPGGLNSMFVKVSLDDLMQVISNETIGSTGYAYYVGQNGAIYSETNTTEKRKLDASLVEAGLAGSEASREFTDSGGIAWVSASAPVKKLGGAIITQQTRIEAYAASRKGKDRAAIIVLSTIFLAIFAAYLLARSLVNPLLKINKVAHEVDLSAGQFPDPISISSKDEIKEMADTFNQMIHKLKGYADLQVEKLIIEQKKTEAIIFSIDDGIIMTDYQGRIQLMSHRAKNILSVNEKIDTAGQPLWKYLPSPEIKSSIMDVLMKPGEKKKVDVKLTKENTDRFFALSSEKVTSPKQKESLGVVTVLHDITLEKQIDSMKEEFLHSITHDLRNPLTAIRGFIRLLQSGQTGQMSDLQNKMLATMDKASLRLLTMVNDILDLARLDSGRLTLHMDNFDVKEVANRIIDLFTPQAETAHIKLKLEIAGQKEIAPLYSDPNLIERVFTNLVGNATKFTPEEGTITIRIEDFDDHIKCSVNDTGEGIPKDYLGKVFDKFKQVEGHFKGGAGLGLTICQRIVQAHEGKIWVESEMDKGSSFIFTIPRNLQRQVKAA